jgi:glycosyltransferase involved in cell wall biosynthesis
MNFDILSTIERKNPVAALQTFARAFGSRSDVRLVVKVWESPPWEFDREALARLQQQLPNATFLLDHLPYTDMLELIRDCDAYVSLHRTEGLGLGILEAMSFGKPVIATDYGGSRDFVDAFCGLPVPYTLVPVDTTQDCYHAAELGAQAYWADANQEVAAEHMRRIQAEPALYHALSAGAFARYHERRAQFLSLKWLQLLLPSKRELQLL